MNSRYSEPTKIAIGYSNEPVFSHLLERNRDEKLFVIDLAKVEISTSFHVESSRSGLLLYTEDEGTIFVNSGTPAFARAFVRDFKQENAKKVRAFLDAWNFYSACSPDGALIINRPLPISCTTSKIAHAWDLVDCGFDVPILSLNNLQDDIPLDRTIKINKGVSTVRTVASREHSAKLLQCDRKLRTPVMLQNFISGYDVRIHVVGTRFFALKISTTADDYRYAKKAGCEIKHSEVLVPAQIQDACWRFMRKAKIEFGGFDFKVDKDEKYWALECNFMPGFSYFDRYHDGCISDAILKYLSRGYSNINYSMRSTSVIDEDRIPETVVTL